MKLKPLFFVSAALLADVCCFGGGTVTDGVPNLVQVEPGLWRGGQPTEQGWAYLRSQGVTNVVKLNLESEASDGTAKRMGMTIYPAPIPFAEQVGEKRLDGKDMEVVLAAVPAQGTFIHCEHGQDRTGLFVAIWRVKRDGWPKSKAEKEMLAHGFHKELHGLWRFWNSTNVVAMPKGAPRASP